MISAWLEPTGSNPQSGIVSYLKCYPISALLFVAHDTPDAHAQHSRRERSGDDG